MSPYWTVEEERVLKQMFEEGKSVKEIAKRFHRSLDAILMKAKRLRIDVPKNYCVKDGNVKVTENFATTTTSMELSAIKPAAELISLGEMMKTLLGALEKLQNPTTLSSLEIKRCRMVVSLAKAYMHMLEKYEKWTSLEQRLVDMEARFLERHKQALKTTRSPREKAWLQKEIKSLEEALRQSAKYYKPFEKKPSLMTPF